jgi:hypothetical protein
MAIAVVLLLLVLVTRVQFAASQQDSLDAGSAAAAAGAAAPAAGFPPQCQDGSYSYSGSFLGPQKTIMAGRNRFGTPRAQPLCR